MACQNVCKQGRDDIIVKVNFHLQHAKNGGRSLGESYNVIYGTHDVTGSRHEDIFTFLSPATEKLEKQDKFQ